MADESKDHKKRVKELLAKLQGRRDLIEEEYLTSLETSDAVSVGGKASSDLLDHMQALDEHIAEMNNQLK